MKRLLEEEFEFAHRFPFLNLLHDLCTTSNGKRSLVGSGSHNSAKVETIITLRIAELYGLAIDCMTQFLMSDTTPSARKISKLYDDTVQLDCTMHVLNLCRVYGLGVPENVKNVCIGDPETNISAKQRRVCTPGEGASLVIKVRGLNNYFNTPQGTGRFTKGAATLRTSELSPIVDLTLYQRIIVTYVAFMAYFQHCAVYDDPDVFKKLSLADWQRLLRIASTVETIDCVISTHFGHQRQTLIRFHALASTLHDDRTSLERIKVQVNKRLSNLTAEPVIIFLLDSRTKFYVGTLITPPQTATTESPKSGNVYNGKVDSRIEEGMRMLRDSHREVYAAEFAASSGVKITALNSPPNLDFVPSIEDEVTICGAQVEMTPDNVSASMLHDQCSLSGTSSPNSGLT
ncbi:hypothetical protein GQ600_10774 [Phytophthora cactorum]|nr:hypothetical protein GQ600_10774 [Phytophthora cactorum]